MAQLVKDDLSQTVGTLFDLAADVADAPDGQSLPFKDVVTVSTVPRNNARRALGMFNGLVKKHGHTDWPVLIAVSATGEVSYRLTPQVADWWAR